jgi:hypothetical protein
MPAFDHPSHLVEDWQLLDGTPVRIRPIRADDLAMHTAFVAGLSNETGYHRLLSPRKPQPDELRRMTDIDYRDRRSDRRRREAAGGHHALRQRRHAGARAQARVQAAA